jgi:hypothetical protein
LASEDFSQEITTTVLWLNEFHSFDIRCIRLSPYKLEQRLLLDVQQVIPLPEASAYTVRVREKEYAVKQATKGTADWTKFIIHTPGGASEPLAKRWAMLRLVEGLVEGGMLMDQVQRILPASKTLKVDGVYADEDDLWSAIRTQLGKSEENRRRWHLASPIVEEDCTWVLNNNWGAQTRTVFRQLLEKGPEGFQVSEKGDSPAPQVN